MLSPAMRNTVYLALISTQVLGMIALDLVHFYPESLYVAPDAPLHFLVALREAYVKATGDPFFGTDLNKMAWFQAFLYVEGLVQFPLAAYVIYGFASGRGTTGATELASLIFGAVTAMGSVACVSTLKTLGPEIVPADMKKQLFYGVYLPFCVFPIFMCIDMHTRIMARVNALDAKLKEEQDAKYAAELAAQAEAEAKE